MEFTINIPKQAELAIVSPITSLVRMHGADDDLRARPESAFPARGVVDKGVVGGRDRMRMEAPGLGPIFAVNRPVGKPTNGRDRTMLWTILVILLVLWALGFLVFHVSSGLIHLLLVIAAIVLVVRLIQGRRVI